MPTSDDNAAPEPEVRGGTNLATDPYLVVAAVALTALGLVMAYSAGAWTGHQLTGDWTHFARRQGMFAALGLLLMLGLSRLDYRVLRRFAPHLLGLGILALIAVLIFGTTVNGARRWIRVAGFGLQPSEFVKPVLVIFLAAVLARQGERVRTLQRGFMPVMIASSLIWVLVLLERDLGTTVLLATLTLTMLYVAGAQLTYVVAALMVAAPIAWWQVIGVQYRRGRWEEFLTGEGYQVKQSLIAIGSGGPFGLGLGNGRQKLGFLPEAHTDFVLAAIGEELGLWGIMLVLLSMGLLCWRGLLAARNASDRFGCYVALGLSATLAIQTLVNAAVVLGVLPAKGITLPLVSYGGSSLLVSLASVGLILSVARRPKAWSVSEMRGRRDARSKAARGPRNQRRTSTSPRIAA